MYGELLSAAHLLATRVGDFDRATAAFLADVADTAAAQWTEPDHGIWEFRGPRRHTLHSKLMSWVAMDRAIKLAPSIGAERPDRDVDEGARRDPRRDRDRGMERRGRRVHAVVRQHALDASALVIPLCGFLDPHDPRVRSTVAAIVDRLTDERGFVYRYLHDDGLAGGEGTFTICTFWLAECLARGGDPAAARQVFDRVVAHRNDVDLLSEEISRATARYSATFRRRSRMSGS